jgi:hypothetical protein
MNITPANIQLEIASFRGQALSALLSTSSTGTETANFADILGTKTSEANSGGRNLALKDPESAFKMMSQINNHEVAFKAQYSELSEMGSSVAHMEEVGRQLSDVDRTTSNDDIVAQLQGFVAQYNTWEDRFDQDIETGGVLNNVQAAEVSIYELEQSVKNIFNGAADGINGLGGLGISIDPVTKQASLDTAKLESVLANNKGGAVNAIDEFSANFAKSADLLNSDGNFIQNALGNRSRAVDFIANNRASLETEFGTGHAAKPTGDAAKALAAYEQAFGIG